MHIYKYTAIIKSYDKEEERREQAKNDGKEWKGKKKHESSKIEKGRGGEKESRKDLRTKIKINKRKRKKGLYKESHWLTTNSCWEIFFKKRDDYNIWKGREKEEEMEKQRWLNFNLRITLKKKTAICCKNSNYDEYPKKMKISREKRREEKWRNMNE